MDILKYKNIIILLVCIIIVSFLGLGYLEIKSLKNKIQNIETKLIENNKQNKDTNNYKNSNDYNNYNNDKEEIKKNIIMCIMCNKNPAEVSSMIKYHNKYCIECSNIDYNNSKKVEDFLKNNSNTPTKNKQVINNETINTSTNSITDISSSNTPVLNMDDIEKQRIKQHPEYQTKVQENIKKNITNETIVEPDQEHIEKEYTQVIQEDTRELSTQDELEENVQDIFQETNNFNGKTDESQNIEEVDYNSDVEMEEVNKDNSDIEMEEVVVVEVNDDNSDVEIFDGNSDVEIEEVVVVEIVDDNSDVEIVDDNSDVEIEEVDINTIEIDKQYMQLKLFKLDILRILLKKNNISYSGNKDKIINRIITNNVDYSDILNK